MWHLFIFGFPLAQVPNHQRMVTNGDESDQRLDELPPATQQIQ
jgi:hypothetical protein